MQPVISIRELTKTYAGGFEALKAVDLDINKGEIFGLLGPNGAGKTTSIGKFARYLDSRGLKVGLITNDQGAGLVAQFDQDALEHRFAGIALSVAVGVFPDFRASGFLMNGRVSGVVELAQHNAIFRVFGD